MLIRKNNCLCSSATNKRKQAVIANSRSFEENLLCVGQDNPIPMQYLIHLMVPSLPTIFNVDSYTNIVTCRSKLP